MSLSCLCPQNQRRQQKLVTLDSFTPPEITAESPVPAEEGEETGNSTQGEEEEPLVESQSSETERSETTPSEQDQEKPQGVGHTEKEEEDCEPVAVSNNHSTVMSEEQRHQSPEGVVKRDGHEPERRGEEEEENDVDAAQPSGDEEDTKLTDKLGELSLNEAFLASEDSDLELGCRDGDTSAEMGNVAFCTSFRPLNVLCHLWFFAEDRHLGSGNSLRHFEMTSV